MVHFPKVTFFHGTLVLPRPFPAWLPVVLAADVVVVLAVAVTAGLSLLGDNSVRAQSSSYSTAAAHVMTYINEWSPEKDPLVTLPGGVQAKASNVYGVETGGTRYYYQMTRSSSFDPVRTGSAGSYEVIAVIDAGTSWEVLIYRLR